MMAIMPKKPKPPFDFIAALGTDVETIQILDVGAMLEGEACYAGLLEKGLAKVIGFEPNPTELARLNQEGAADCTWLPYFLGDGREATFHLTHYPGCSSLYPPDPNVINLFETIGAEQGENFSVFETETVETKRLDDVEECPSMDFVKIDVQGGELDILCHGAKTLGTVTVIQAEVEFVPVYKDQPLFGDMQVFLRDLGFQLHKFIDIAGRCFRPFQMKKNPHGAMSQALWADAVFVRDFTQLDSFSDAQLLKTAAILHEIYLSFDFVRYFLDALDRRQGGDLAERYMSALQQNPPNQRLFMNLKEYID